MSVSVGGGAVSVGSISVAWGRVAVFWICTSLGVAIFSVGVGVAVDSQPFNNAIANNNRSINHKREDIRVGNTTSYIVWFLFFMKFPNKVE